MSTNTSSTRPLNWSALPATTVPDAPTLAPTESGTLGERGTPWWEQTEQQRRHRWQAALSELDERAER